MVPSLLMNQQIASIMGHKFQAKHKGTPQGSHHAGFVSWLQSTALKDQTPGISDSHDTLTNSSEWNETDIQVLERKISLHEIKDRQKW